MSEENEKIKYPGFLNKLWYDPIWSKVIYASIILVIGLLYSFLSTQVKNVSFKQAFVETINFNLPIWQVFILITIGLLTYGILFKIRQKRKRHLGRFDVDQPIGNFKFRELYNALLTHNLKLPISLSAASPDGKMNLVKLFVLYQKKLNIGINWDAGGDQGMFLYHELGPILMSYGLTELTPCKNKVDTLKLDLIITSKIGHKFFALLEGFRVYNDEVMKEDITKTDDGKTDKAKSPPTT